MDTEAVSRRDAVNLHPYERWVSAASGAVLTISGMRRGLQGGKLRMALGAEMLRRGISGHCYAYKVLGVVTAPETKPIEIPYEPGVHVRLAMTIAKPRSEVFAFWRDFSNLPKVMRHLRSVEVREGGVTRWTAIGPMDTRLRWDAEIVNESQNERISWRSLPGARVESSGAVLFTDAPGGKGTEVRIDLQYRPPAGALGIYAAKLFGRAARATIEADCWRLKEYLETGEVPTIEGQPKGPSGRESRRRRVEVKATHSSESLEARL